MAFQDQSVLEHLTCAWSRDQAEKIYVQDRLLENGADVWHWLEGGAIVYVCGDAHGMAPAVHQALQAIAREQGGLDEAGAQEWLESLAASGRYRRDVY